MEELQNKINKLSSDLKKEDNKLNHLIEHIYKNDESNESQDFLSNDMKEYNIIKKKYKEYINQFSKAYIEMSDVYVGEELSYQDYCKHYKPTYLDNKKSVEELYGLFIFFMLLSSQFNNIKT